MLDYIEIISLEVVTKIGIHAWEQAINQKLFIDLKLPVDCTNCCEDLSQTIDYEELCNQVINFVTERSFKLIETVANDVANLLKTNFKLTSIIVSVSKPNAIKQARDIRVTVQR